MTTSFYIPFLTLTKPFVVSTTILVLSSLINLTIFTNSQITTPIHRSHFCSSNQSSTFPPNSTYQSNLNTLLSSLSSAAALGKNFSHQALPPALFGSFLCRGDLGVAACAACVATATSEAAERCPFGREAVLWYNGCTVRYSDRSFAGRLDEAPRAVLVDEFNGTSQASLQAKAIDLAAAREAAREPGRFGTREVQVTPLRTIYSLVQCTPDLSSGECEKCLSDAMGVVSECCEGKEGVTILFPSCTFRYELFPFYYSRTIVNSTDPLIKTKHKEKGRISTLAITVIVVCAILVSLAIFALGFYLCRLKRAKNNKDFIVPPQIYGENEITNADSLQFPLITIETATNEFSLENKIGRGGFGDVYKGVLPNGQEIAVKRQLKLGYGRSGEEEFKNEVALVAKLQHRNLVRLLGFCLEGGETVLVYEFVPNKSLDYFLFDPKKKELLDWSQRCKIIGGIARGILYLHEDSRLRVIHRDLKASNVLLDKEMNPKISDFGIAKMFGIEGQTDEGRTRTIVGTYGYMAPEYAMEGRYSPKSDVFSFGVLLLEILSGEKNSNFNQTDSKLPYLLAHAWQLWNEEKGLDFMDPVLKNSYCARENEFLRYMHIGLLCAQEDPNIRPTMSFVALALFKSESGVRLPNPERPPLSFAALSDDKYDHDQYNQSISKLSNKSFTVSITLPR